MDAHLILVNPEFTYVVFSLFSKNKTQTGLIFSYSVSFMYLESVMLWNITCVGF